MKLNAPNSKYAKEKTQYYQVGYSKDPDERVASLNKGLIPELTGYSWTIELVQNFPDEQHTFNFEQGVHRRLTSSLVDGEREIYAIDYAELRSTWIDVFHNAEWSP
jgi:hypothetical protein